MSDIGKEKVVVVDVFVNSCQLWYRSMFGRRWVGIAFVG
jgi:hypothetical protein